MIKKNLQLNTNNEVLAVSFIWKDRSIKSFSYVLITIVLNPM